MAKKSQAPKPGPRKKPVPRGKVRVRMYRQGLGDCFLLAFPKPAGGDFFVLIDCGVILGTPDADNLMDAVAADVMATTKGKVDVLVVTHEHWDHVSGFYKPDNPDKKQGKWRFDGLQVGQVWMAWTEDPNDQIARGLRRERGQKLAALWMGLHQMQNRFGAAGVSEADRDSVERAAEVLSFFGIDASEPPPTGGLGAAADAAGGKTGAAMRWARDKTGAPKFWRPGNVIQDADAPPGVRVYVLGPPTDRKQLFKDLPTRAGRETYDEKDRPAAAMQAFFGVDNRGGSPDGGPVQPFERKYRIPPGTARQDVFLREHYYGTGPDDPEAYRRIDGAWTGGAAELALQLDSDTNNTSLALAFELADGRVLLFPGDAQVGNWESWHADSQGKPLTWEPVPGRTVSAEQLLNRTVLYKTGHHGSHNATLREKGLEMMTDKNLVAMVPVDVYIAHEKKRWKQMPFNPLMQRLRDVTAGRVIQADEPLAAANGKPKGGKKAKTPDAKFPGQPADSAATIQTEVAANKKATRPLYVEYELP